MLYAIGVVHYLPVYLLTEVQCGFVPKIKNGTTRMVGKAYFGNSTTYTCDKGYEMTGSPIVSCQADGTWTQLPQCTGKWTQLPKCMGCVVSKKQFFFCCKRKLKTNIDNMQPIS